MRGTMLAGQILDSSLNWILFSINAIAKKQDSITSKKEICDFLVRISLPISTLILGRCFSVKNGSVGK